MRREKKLLSCVYKKISLYDFNLYINDILHCINELRKDKGDSERILANMKSFIEDGSANVIGCINNNSLVGFIWGYNIDMYNIHINYFVVKEEYRSLGIGKNLLMSFTQNLCNVNNVNLLVNKNNFGAISFYEHNGFLREQYSDDKYKMNLMVRK